MVKEAEAVLDDPAYAENPLRPVVAQLLESIRLLERRLEKISNISDQYQARLMESNAHLEEAAHTDLLTGLPNRRDMQERLQHELRRSQRSGDSFAVLLMDIDHFKQVNDTYGHLVGDRVLVGAADLVRRTLRGYDYCARWGGEEFLVLLPETGRDGAVVIAERLRKKIADTPFTIQDQTLSITISIGGTCYTPGQTFDQVMQMTDDMLYCAKDGGRNRVCFIQPD